jgi:hypothetical protein
MLGWGINIWRQIDDTTKGFRNRNGFVAGWEATLEGIKWLDALVANGQAADLGGNGYPLRYTATASVIARQLANGPPNHPGPVTIGDDYCLPSGWTGSFEIDQAELAKCSPDEVLSIEAWDLS